jgi:hypothetical protein
LEGQLQEFHLWTRDSERQMMIFELISFAKICIGKDLYEAYEKCNFPKKDKIK